MIPQLRCSVVRGLTTAVVFLFTLSFARAGDITGQVFDGNSGGYLPGANVTLQATGVTTVTDSDGRFSFSDVPAGKATVRVDYLGYGEQTASVEVPATGSAQVMVSLGEQIVQLEKFTVEGYREGRSKALQQKKSASNLQDIISADSVGNLPDRNVAEALARVPGISLDVVSGNGEGRFISVRGIEPNFNTVTLNGATLAAPTAGGREGRAMPLDVISSSQISQIEVVKAVTPDMDGNALGASINIKTASGFDRREGYMFGKLEIGRNSVADDPTYMGEFTYGNTFKGGTVGLAASGTYSKRPWVEEGIQARWGQSGGKWYPSTFELHPYSGEKTRKGMNLNLEFRPDADTQWYVRAMYNKFDNDQREQEFIMEMRDNGSNPVTFPAPTVVTMGRMRYEQRDFRREIDQTVNNVSVGGKMKIGDLTWSGDFTWSQAKEDVPFIYSVQFRTGNVTQPAGSPWTVNFGSFRPVYLNAVNDPAIYPLRRYRIEDSFADEKDWTPRLDVQRDFTDLFGGHDGFLKAGVKYNHRTRIIDDNSVRPVNTKLTMANILTPKPAYTFMEGRYRYPSEIEVNDALVYYNAHKGDFTIDPNESASNSIEDDYDTTEKVFAVYGMASVNLSKKTTVLGGIRWEQTDASILGYEYQSLNGNFKGVVTNRGSFKYDNFLPNLQSVWRLNDRSLIRTAITGTIGRPQYEKAAPKSVLEIEEDTLGGVTTRSGSLEIGNPDLKPYESLNFDLSYEYYLPQGGMFSIAGFHKRIKNPIYQFILDEQNVSYNGLQFDSLTRTEFRNANSARVTGLELNLQLPFSVFSFVNGTFLDGFGAELNGTFNSSKTDVFERPGSDLPFFRQPDRIYNAALYFEKYGLSARIAWNHQSESLHDLGDDKTTDIWDRPRDYTDFQASYKVTQNLSIYLEWQNIFEDRAERSYDRESGRIRTSFFYGSYLRGGVRFRY